MRRSAKPEYERIVSADSRTISPHPPLPHYYGDAEARQGFLNDLFDRTAYQYRNIDKATGFGSGLWYRKKALELAGLKPGMRVLDVACGPGLVAQCALQVVGLSGSVTGLDPSSGMLREAQKGSCRNLVRGVGENLPFRNEQFDFLSMGYALRHLSELKGAFAEYRRVLKPGGIVLLLEVSRPSSALLVLLARFYIKTILGITFTARTGSLDMKELMAYWWETTERCVPPETIIEALKDSGFHECHVKEWCSGLLRDYRAVKPATQ